MTPRPTSFVLLAVFALLLRPGGAAAAVPHPTDVADLAPPIPASTAGPVTEAVRAAADRALQALARHVKKQSDPDALRLAFRAYFAFAETRPAEVRKPYLFYVDYGLGNRTRRGYVFDMEKLKLVEGPFTVAHGRGSSKSRNAVPDRFSNTPGSLASSLGLYVAQETYRFRGKSAGRPYTSLGLRMKGVSGPFNDAARRRGIVVHGAPYVTGRDAGRSQGCPAMEQSRARRLLPLLADGALVFLYSPRDERWLRNDRWLRS